MDLPFRKVVLADKKWIDARLRESGFMGCEYSFGNIFIWREPYKQLVLDYKGFFVAKSEARRGLYSFPAGRGDLRSLIADMAADGGGRIIIRGVTDGTRAELENVFPGGFDYIPMRDEFDYIYSQEKLATLAGKKLHKKRNHVARFNDNPIWGYEPITRDNINECREMSDKWSEINGRSEGLKSESIAVGEAFANFFELGFAGGLIRREGRVIAFAMGEPLNRDTFVIHIEKAFHDIQGAYPVINQQFALHNCAGFKFVNREEDVGDDGLRKSKGSYYPEFMLVKYNAFLRGGAL
jgi:hypothetical protein